MAEVLDFLYGPLSSDYCVYFYFLQVYFLISLILFVGTSLYTGLSKRKSFSYYFSRSILGLAIFFMYFQNRLLYTMCTNKMR